MSISANLTEARPATSTDNRLQAMIDSMTLEKVSVESLVPWDRNPRVHGEDVGVLVNSMTHFGWTNPVLAQRGTNRIIAGHGRIEAARKKGIAVVPVIFLELEDQDAAAYTIADNASAERSEWDLSKLHEILDELDISGFDLNFTGLDEQFLKTAGDGTGAAEISEDEGIKYQQQYAVIVMCANDDEQQRVYERLTEELGYTCKVVVT